MNSLPEMIKVEQILITVIIKDIERHTLSECEKFKHLFKPGEKNCNSSRKPGNYKHKLQYLNNYKVSEK